MHARSEKVTDVKWFYVSGMVFVRIRMNVYIAQSQSNIYEYVVQRSVTPKLIWIKNEWTDEYKTGEWQQWCKWNFILYVILCSFFFLSRSLALSFFLSRALINLIDVDVNVKCEICISGAVLNCFHCT